MCELFLYNGRSEQTMTKTVLPHPSMIDKLVEIARRLRSIRRPSEAADLQHVVRANLSAWSRRLHVLRGVLPNQAFVAFSPDGRQVALVTEEEVKSIAVELWDVAKSERLKRFEAQSFWGPGINPAYLDQAYGKPLEPDQDLPPLRTNNKQLATMVGCSGRTIINLRERLAAALMIAPAAWHGTNSSYELAISFDIIQLELRGDPTNQVGLFEGPLSADRKPQTADRISAPECRV